MYVLNRLNRESRLKSISGIALLMLFLATAGFQSQVDLVAAEDELLEGSATVAGIASIAIGDPTPLPNNTYAFLVYDEFDSPYSISEDTPEAIAAETLVDTETGSFSFENVEDGYYLVVIRPPVDSDYAASDPYFVSVENGQAAYELSILLYAAQVKGTVISSVTEQTVEAKVELFDLTNYNTYTTKTQEGAFSFGGLQTSGDYEIVVYPDRSEPYSDSVPEVIQVTSDGVTEVTIELDAPSVIGTVYGPDQEPLPSVHVSAFRKFSGNSGPGSGPLGLLNDSGKDFTDDFTGSNGMFALGKLRPGTYLIEAYGHDYTNYIAPDPIEIEIPYDGPELVMQFTELEPGVKTVTGLVKDEDNNLIDNAFVIAQHQYKNLTFEAETDENGEYILNLTGGEWVIFVEQSDKDGMGDTLDEDPFCEGVDCPPANCEMNPDMCQFSLAENDSGWIYNEGPQFVTFEDNDDIESKIVDFEVVAANSTIEGTILNSTDEIPTYWVSIGAFNSEGHGTHTEIDETGYFKLQVPAGFYELFIHADVNSGEEAPEVISVTVDEDETVDLGEITMVGSSSSISGKVTASSSGNLIKDVPIIAWKVDGVAHREATTNSNGEYTLYVSAGTWFVTPAYSPESNFVFNNPGEEVKVLDGDEIIRVDFEVISSESEISGLVVDSNGEKISNAFGWVHVESVESDTDDIDNPLLIDDPVCETPEDCPLPPHCEPGDGDDGFQQPRSEDPCEPPHCEPGDGDDGFNQQPRSDDPCEPPHCEPGDGDDGFNQQPRSDDPCEPPHCEPGDGDDGFNGQLRTEEDPCKHEGPECETAGSAVDPEETCDNGYDAPEFMTGGPINNGQFSVKVPAGTYRVMMFVDGEGIFADQSVEVTVGENDVQEITISALSADATIQGQVVDARDDTPITDVFGHVFAWSENNFADSFISKNTGEYSMAVISGTWHIDFWVEHEDYVPLFNPERTTTVESSGSTTYNLPVAKLDAELTGRVLNPDGSTPLRGAEIIIRGLDDMEDVWRFARTDQSGAFRAKVPYGTYEVEAAYVIGQEENNWFRPEPVEVTAVQDAETTVEDLIFRAATSTLTGTLTAEGATVDGEAMVWAWSPTGGFTRQEVQMTSDGTDATGSYSLSVIDGKWFVDAAMEANNSFWYGESEVSVTESAQLDLTITSQGQLPDVEAQTFDASEPFEMTLDDGTKISIPAGAMPVTGTVSITIDPIATLPDQDHAEVVNYGYQILAKDSTGALIEQSFDEAVTITFFYNPDQTGGIPESDLEAAYFSTTTEQWTIADTLIVDAENNSITMRIDHFTDFAVVGDPSKAVSSSNTIYLPFITR